MKTFKKCEHPDRCQKRAEFITLKHDDRPDRANYSCEQQLAFFVGGCCGEHYHVWPEPNGIEERYK